MFTPQSLKQKAMIPRYNDLENRTLQMLMSKARITELYNSYSATTIQIQKKYSNANKLFVDACSPILTPYGNESKTEFVIHLPMYKINWRIECKSQIKDSPITKRIDWDLYHAPVMYEDKLCLVLEGAFLFPKNVVELATEIERRGIANKVWFGCLAEFEAMLLAMTA